MPAPIELALTTLLPTLSFLPPDIISLSNSLLAQSRAKAASLKPEEEIARTYACCHIACDRLKKRLDLEIGKPAPPVKPRVYEKLFRYLDGVLTTPVTPRRDRVTNVATAKSKTVARTPTTATRRTSNVDVDLDKTPTTISSKRTRTDTDKQDDEEQEVPAFAMPMVRALCKANTTPSAVPHVLVGAASVVREILSRNVRRPAEDPPSKRRRRSSQPAKSTTPTANEGTRSSSIAASKWSALLVAIHLLVTAKMRSLDIEDADSQAVRAKSIEAVIGFCADARNTLPSDIDAGTDKLQSTIDFYILEAEDYGWLGMDWYQNVPSTPADADLDGNAEQDDGDDDDEQVMTPKNRPYKTPLRRKEKHGGKDAFDLDDAVGAAGLVPGLGTMFQPAIDWLSDERQMKYGRWKQGILNKIHTVEGNAMQA